MEQAAISELVTRWDIPTMPTVLLALVGATYVVGWFRVHKSRPADLPPWRRAAFLSGIASVFVAIRWFRCCAECHKLRFVYCGPCFAPARSMRCCGILNELCLHGWL